MFALDALGFLIVTIMSVGVPSAADFNQGMDELLFKSFCDRPSVLSTVQDCFIGIPEKEKNVFGEDTLSGAATGGVYHPDGNSFPPTGTPKDSSFTIVGKDKIMIQCRCLSAKQTKDPKDFAQIIPATDAEVALDISSVFTYEQGGIGRMEGVFTKGATVVFKSDAHFECEWDQLTE